MTTTKAPDWNKLRDSLSIALRTISFMGSYNPEAPRYTLGFRDDNDDPIPMPTQIGDIGSIPDNICEITVLCITSGPDMSIRWAVPVHGTEESGRVFLIAWQERRGGSSEDPPGYDEKDLQMFSAGQERVVAEYVTEHLAIYFIGKRLDDAETFREQMLADGEG